MAIDIDSPWCQWIICINQLDLRQATIRHLAVALPVTVARTYDAMTLALNDGRSPLLLPAQRLEMLLAEAAELFRKSKPEMFARLTERSPDLAQHAHAGQMISKKLADEIYNNRLAPHALEWAKFIDPSLPALPIESSSRLMALVIPRHPKTQMRIVDYRSPDQRDLLQEARAGAIAQYHRLTHPNLPLTFENYVGHTAVQLEALMRLKPGRAAYEAARRIFDQRSAKKRGGSGSRGTETPEERIRDVPLDGDRPTFEEELMEARIEAGWRLRRARQLYGAKGEHLLALHDKGLTIKDAAAKAGVAFGTAKRWFADLLKKK